MPPRPALDLLRALGRPVDPSGASAPLGLLMASDEVELSGLIRFVPAGFIAADRMLAWTADDLLASLRDSVEQANPARARQNQTELDARDWVQPPRYDPAAHQLAWAALIVPKTAPRGSDGEVSYHAFAFGREGYIELTMPASFERAGAVTRLTGAFLGGLSFLPGKAYQDAGPAEHPSEHGLADATGLGALHKASIAGRFWSLDMLMPAIGAALAAIGIIALLTYIARHARQEARRG